MQKIYASINIRKRTPAGKLFVHILENNSGDPVIIQANLGKCGSEALAMTQALAAMCTSLLSDDNGNPIVRGLERCIENLSGYTTDKSVPAEPGIQCRSIPEGFLLALLDYKRTKFEEFQREYGIHEIRPRIRRKVG